MKLRKALPLGSSPLHEQKTQCPRPEEETGPRDLPGRSRRFYLGPRALLPGSVQHRLRATPQMAAHTCTYTHSHWTERPPLRPGEPRVHVITANPVRGALLSGRNGAPPAPLPGPSRSGRLALAPGDRAAETPSERAAQMRDEQGQASSLQQPSSSDFHPKE